MVQATNARRRRLKLVLGGIAFAGWLGATACALGAIAVQASIPNEAADAPSRWPSSSAIPRTPGRPTLVLFAHAQCPCTRATLHELARLLVHIGDRADVWVLFSGPIGGRTDIRDDARALPGVHVVEDDGRAETRRFHVRTSGEVLLYSSSGELSFAGGITPSRGHEGDSAGSARIEQLLSAPQDVAKAPATAGVFGCALFERIP
ncbi:MAG TPA: hypothetical protein VIF62_19380 [Labilithrix sp.]